MQKYIWLFLSIVTLAFMACAHKEQKPAFEEETDPAILLEYGNKFYQSGDYENAFIAYRLIYEHYPQSREYIDATIGLSKCYGAFEQYEKQFDLLYQLLRENLIPSKVPLIYNAIAEFYENSAGISQKLTGESTPDYLKAIGYYQKAVDYENSDDQQAKGYAQYKIGYLYETIKDYPKAIAAYEKTINNYQGTEWAHRAEQAIADLKQRLEQKAAYQGIAQPTLTDTTHQAATGAAPSPADTLKPTGGTADTSKVVPVDTTATPPAAPPAPPDTTKKPKLELQ